LDSALSSFQLESTHHNANTRDQVVQPALKLLPPCQDAILSERSAH